MALVQLNTTSSASCLCFGRSKRGGKLWSALHHGHIESGPVASPPIVTEPSVAFSEQYPANGPDATQAADTADSYDPLRSQRRRRQTVQEAGGDVFLLQARLGRVSWNLVLDTTDGKRLTRYSNDLMLLIHLHRMLVIIHSVLLMQIIAN